MSFQFKSVYVGPYVVSEGKGAAGDIQLFQFPVPLKSDDSMQGAQFLLSGQLSCTSTALPNVEVTLDAGAEFLRELPERPMLLNEEVTLRAVADAVYLCVVPADMPQQMHLMAKAMKAGDRHKVCRFDLVAIAGENPIVSLNGCELKSGSRIAYARTSDLEVVAHSPCVVGVFSLVGP